MPDQNIPKCPKCGKELKWIPKGTHLCRCGEVIKTEGKDLEAFEFSEDRIPLKERLPTLIEIELVLAILLVLATLILRVLYQRQWVQWEAELMNKIFGTDPKNYYEIIGPLTAAAFISIIIFYKVIKVIRK